MDRVQKILGIQEEDPSEIEKFNPNHDPDTGRFSEAHSGMPAGVNPYASVPMPGSGGPYTYTTASGMTVTDSEGLSQKDRDFYVKYIDYIKKTYRLTELGAINFIPLEEGVFAQARVEWKQDGLASYEGGKYDVRLNMQISPNARSGALKTWESDKALIASNQQPWTAISYAHNENDLLRMVINHETGHMLMSKQTLKANRNDWVDPNDPLEGTKGWKKVVDDSVAAGWSPPSQYAQTDYGEMFSECFALTATGGTTGSKDVDGYVRGVAENA